MKTAEYQTFKVITLKWETAIKLNDLMNVHGCLKAKGTIDYNVRENDVIVIANNCLRNKVCCNISLHDYVQY
jgi:hypothetical protein